MASSGAAPVCPGEASQLDDLHGCDETESERLQDILRQIRSIQSLPSGERRAKLAGLTELLQQNASKEELRRLFDSLDSALVDFLGDPRRFVACISQILTCFETSAEKAQLAIQRFLQDKQVGSSPTPFDWTMVDILLSQLSHLAGEDAIFTREMQESVVFALFHPRTEAHFLQDIVSQCLLLSVSEKITVVQERMRALSQAPLAKVTLLANMVREINEKYEKELQEFVPTVIIDGPPRDDM
jgi:hypothetical protein